MYGKALLFDRFGSPADFSDTAQIAFFAMRSAVHSRRRTGQPRSITAIAPVSVTKPMASTPEISNGGAMGRDEPIRATAKEHSPVSKARC
jgi:hypothetical protein